jgi:hypothetical protein
MSNLIPEKRINKNGVAVTKHVRLDMPNVLKTSLLPAPVLPATGHKQAPLTRDELFDKLKPNYSNQLVSLERDLKDAAKIRQTLALWASDRTPSDQLLSRLLLVKTWQEVRLPRPRQGAIRPIEYPWSESARDLFFKGRATGNLKLEHVKPASYLINEILFPAAEDPECTDQMFLDLLVKEHSRLSFTIVTDIEDDMINAAGYKDKHVESDDDWERYKLSGIDTSTFKSLIEDDRFKRKMTKVWGGKLSVMSQKELRKLHDEAGQLV